MITIIIMIIIIIIIIIKQVTETIDVTYRAGKQ